MSKKTAVLEQPSSTSTTSVEPINNKTDYAVLYEELKSNYVSAMGKSIGGVLAVAKTIAEAQKMLKDASLAGFGYSKFLSDVAKMGKSTADKYISIDVAFGEVGTLNQFVDKLPVNWTAIYQLSRFAIAEDLTPAKARKAFLEAVKFINTPDEKGNFPTVADITEKVSVLLGNPAKPKEKWTRKGNTVTITPAPVEGIPDGKTGEVVTNQASAPLGESEAEDEEDDSVEATVVPPDQEFDIDFQNFAATYDKMRIHPAISKTLRSLGISPDSVELILRQKGTGEVA